MDSEISGHALRDKARFLVAIDRALKQPVNEPFNFPCPSGSVARKLRRRFYYLRTLLTEEETARLDKLIIKVNGRFIYFHKRPQLPEVTTDVPSNA